MRLTRAQRIQAKRDVQQLGAIINFVEVIKKYMPIYKDVAAALEANPTPKQGQPFHNTTTDTVWVYYYYGFLANGLPDPELGGEYNDEGVKMDSPVYWAYVWSNSMTFYTADFIQINGRGGLRLQYEQSDFANDAAAAAGGIAVGNVYFDTTKGAYTKRVV